jgi:hypothetical protein
MFCIIMRFAGVWYRRVAAVTLNELFGKMFIPPLLRFWAASERHTPGPFITI